VEHKEVFLNKHCELVMKDGFVLHGVVIEVTESGVIFQTDSKTSFIGFCDISLLKPEGKK